ncbi:MAG: U32 family peptidase [Bacilli bacterium]|nr:U32 family peptidase [Bacilli bacterium]
MNSGIKNEKDNIIKKPELLAPAGDLERLKWAIIYGADAVYIGGPAFGLRANATNFSFEDIKEGVIFAHSRGKRVHVTINIVLHNKETTLLIEYLKKIASLGVDAIIVSDPTVIYLAKKHTNLEIHLSTQQSTLNKEAICFWEKEGVTRVVLGRETAKEDIIDIINNTNVEIESFIHGAMCASYSGRCVLSNFLTARDANRGGCSQICRWDFKLSDENKKSLSGEKDFTLCAKDLTMLKYIPEMIDIGISSFKIEGRMRSIYYIATVVNIYRRVIDEYCHNPKHYQYNKEYERILSNCANRESITQFYDGNYYSDCQYYNGREEMSNQDFLGVILDYDKSTSLATIEQRNYFKKGDIVEIFGPEIATKTLVIDEIYDENDNQIDIVRHPKQIVKIRINEQIYPNNLMRIKRS